jgi:AmmeMemoRadiSam system radical SAM enzyme/AmmeMemoRadiSam system protein B/AmmeMemoRadiSam system protein A
MSRVVTLPPQDSSADDGIRLAGWWRDAEDGQRLQCQLCPRGCLIRPGERGFCFVRENVSGRMVSTTYGRSTGFCIDPIEKKPLNHFYPGTSVLSFGTAGCNLGCKYCQNWSISKSRDVEAASETAAPEAIAEAAVQLRCRSVAFTYNDPIVWAEYAIDTARECRKRGIKTVAVTSGYMMPNARAPFYEHIDAANIDLKAFGDDFYCTLTGGHLQPVLDTLSWVAHHSNTWLEITNLLIPQANDSLDDIARMCRWIVEELGPDVPLHFSAFHPAFKLMDRGPTPPETLVAAYDIARAAGLRYVYTGNVSDAARQTTYCPGCGQAAIVRRGYDLGDYAIRGGHCTLCDTPIAGRLDDRPGDWGGRRELVSIAALVAAKPAVAKAPPPTPPTQRPLLTEEQQRLVFRAAGRRVAAAVRAEPNRVVVRSILGDIADIGVYGAFVSLKRGGQLRACCGYLGPGALGEAIARAAVRAATDDPRFPEITPAELDSLDMEVWLLWGLEPVAVRGRDRVKAIDIGRHGVQISKGAARGLLLPCVAIDHHLDARGLLQQVCIKAGLPSDAWLQDDVALMTFEAYSIGGRLSESSGGLSQFSSDENGTVPLRTAAHSSPPGPADRPPAVAGTFYPGRRDEMDRAIDEFLALPPTEPQPWSAAMAPHAGWIYSGRLAAAVFSRVRIPAQTIIFCPRHSAGGAAWAVAPYARWLIPGGALAGDVDLARQLSQSVAGLQLDAGPHRDEHAIEVQLPLLARLAPQTRVVGITIGGGDLTALCRFAEQLAGVLRDMPERPLLVISSDMNHFADETETRRLDRLALDAMASLDPARLYETVQQHDISMCGMRPAAIVMETLRQLGLLRRCQEVGYTTSAERSGDARRVVGYAGVLLG